MFQSFQSVTAATGFYDLINEGYLPQAIINYIALLGWCPKDNQEIFTLAELEKEFDVSGISKSPSIFDYDKLSWFNGEYLKAMTPGRIYGCLYAIL